MAPRFPLDRADLYPGYALSQLQLLAGTLPQELRDSLVQLQVFPRRLATPGGLRPPGSAIIENPMLSGEVVPARRRRPQAAQVNLGRWLLRSMPGLIIVVRWAVTA